MEDLGLIIGMELGNQTSQVCYYNTSSNVPESAAFAGDTVILENPVNMDVMVSEAKEGLPSDLDELISLIAFLIEAARKSAGRTKVHKIYVTADRFEVSYLDVIRAAFDKLGYDDKSVNLISHHECCAYYAFSQKKDLWNGGVFLMDYNTVGLKCCVLSKINSKGTDIIVEEYREFTDDLLKKVITEGEGLDCVETILLEAAKDMISGKIISSVYLTGKGFDTDAVPKKFLQFLCGKRRVFSGQNLYVKGACYAALEDTNPIFFENTVLACKNRITTGIEIGIVEYGAEKRLRVIKMGSNWYNASRTLDFIAEDCSELVLNMIPAAGKECYEERIELTGFPYREGKMTRLHVHFMFHSEDRCMISVKDLGFGDFAKSSGKAVYKDLNL